MRMSSCSVFQSFVHLVTVTVILFYPTICLIHKDEEDEDIPSIKFVKLSVIPNGKTSELA